MLSHFNFHFPKDKWWWYCHILICWLYIFFIEVYRFFCPFLNLFIFLLLSVFLHSVDTCLLLVLCFLGLSFNSTNRVFFRSAVVFGWSREVICWIFSVLLGCPFSGHWTRESRLCFYFNCGFFWSMLLAISELLACLALNLWNTWSKENPGNSLPLLSPDPRVFSWSPLFSPTSRVFLGLFNKSFPTFSVVFNRSSRERCVLPVL